MEQSTCGNFATRTNSDFRVIKLMCDTGPLLVEDDKCNPIDFFETHHQSSIKHPVTIERCEIILLHHKGVGASYIHNSESISKEMNAYSMARKVIQHLAGMGAIIREFDVHLLSKEFHKFNNEHASSSNPILEELCAGGPQFNLRHLTLRIGIVSEGLIQQIVGLLERNSGLVKLNLCLLNRFHQESNSRLQFSSLGRALSHHSSIETLSVTCAYLSDVQDLGFMFDGMSTSPLRTLKINSVSFSDQDAAALASFLCSPWSRLSYLSLGECAMTDESIAVVAAAIVQSKTLDRIKLDCGLIGLFSANGFAGVTAQNQSLSRIRIRIRPGQSSNTGVTPESLKKSLDSFTMLTRIDTGRSLYYWNVELAPWLASCSSLSYFTLADGGSDKEENSKMNALYETLGKHSSLRALVIKVDAYAHEVPWWKLPESYNFPMPFYNWHLAKFCRDWGRHWPMPWELEQNRRNRLKEIVDALEKAFAQNRTLTQLTLLTADGVLVDLGSRLRMVCHNRMIHSLSRQFWLLLRGRAALQSSV